MNQNPRQTVNQPRHFLMRTQVAAVILALLLIAGVGTTYAAFTGQFKSLTQALNHQFGVPAAQADRTINLDQTQSIGNVTINMKKATINKKFIVVGYTTTSLTKDPYRVKVRDLKIDHGNQADTLKEGVGDQIPVQDSKASNAIYFQIKDLPQIDQEIKGHLTLIVSQNQKPDQTVAFTFTIPAK